MKVPRIRVLGWYVDERKLNPKVELRFRLNDSEDSPFFELSTEQCVELGTMLTVAGGRKRWAWRYGGMKS